MAFMNRITTLTEYAVSRKPIGGTLPRYIAVATPMHHMKQSTSCRRKTSSTFFVGSGRMYVGAMITDEACLSAQSRICGLIQVSRVSTMNRFTAAIGSQNG